MATVATIATSSFVLSSSEHSTTTDVRRPALFRTAGLRAFAVPPCPPECSVLWKRIGGLGFVFGFGVWGFGLGIGFGF